MSQEFNPFMKKILLIASLLFITSLSSQNQGAISGTIIDKEMNNEPLLFADVSLKSIGKRVRTNFHGNFELTNIDAGNYVLVISYLGYETLEIPVTVKKNIVTQIHDGLVAKNISLDDMTSITLTSKEETTLNTGVAKFSSE